MEISRRGFLKLSGSVLASMLLMGKVGAVSEEEYKKAVEYFLESFPHGPKDPIDDTLCFFDFIEPRSHFRVFDGFNKIRKDINEPIRDPDEITNELIKGMYLNKDVRMRFGRIDISPTDFAVWLAVASKKTVTIPPYLVYVDTDGDGKPEELAALYNPQEVYTDEKPLKRIKEHLKPWPKASYSYYLSYYCVNPFDWEKAENKDELNSLQRLLYWENPESVNVLIESPGNNEELKKTTISLEECLGKTPAEIGLDKYDFKPEYGKTSTPSSKPHIEEYSQKAEKVPGFEIFAGLAGLGLAALNKRK